MVRQLRVCWSWVDAIARWDYPGDDALMLLARQAADNILMTHQTLILQE